MGFKMKPKSPLTMKLVSALKHKPWSAAHKERPAHSATAEAHNAVPTAPTKKYVSDAQRKAVHASKAEQSPAKLKKKKKSKRLKETPTKPPPVRIPEKPIDMLENTIYQPAPPPEKWPSLQAVKPLTLPDNMKKHYVKARKKKKSPAKLIKRKKPNPKTLEELSKIRIPGPGYTEMIKRKKEKEQAKRKKGEEKRKKILNKKPKKKATTTPAKLKKPTKAKKKTNTVGTGFMNPPYKDTVKGSRPYAKRQGYHGYKDFISVLDEEFKRR